MLGPILALVGLLALAAAVWHGWGGSDARRGVQRRLPDWDREAVFAAHPDAGRVQVHLFWGGGQPRDWAGSWQVSGTSGPARVVWIWLTDFEDGDRQVSGLDVPDPRQAVPRTLLEQTPPTERQRRRVPRMGAAVRTRTEGEADGVSFEWLGPTSAEVLLDFGDVRLRASIDELLRGTRVVSVSPGGQVLMASAQDLEATAPEQESHDGQPVRRVCLHTHSAFSTGTTSPEEIARSLMPFARHIWWTDHNPTLYYGLLAGDFEDAELVGRYWLAQKKDARLTRAGVVAPGRHGQSAYRLAATGVEDRQGQAWISLQGGRNAGELHVALTTEPILHFSWRPLQGTAWVQVHTQSGRRLRYLSAAPADGLAPFERVLASTRGEWSDHERNLLRDFQEIYGEQITDGVLEVSFGVLCDGKGGGDVVFDDLELDLPPASVRLAIRQRAYAAEPRARSHPGMEQSAWRGPTGYGRLFPHVTLLAPRLDPHLFVPLDLPPDAQQREAAVAAFQAAGGVAGVHHLQIAEHYEAFLDGGGLGVDLFEVGGAWYHVPAYATPAERRDRDAHGYPALDEDEVYPLLVRWDRTTARGLLLTAYGAPDLQGRFDRPTRLSLNRWLTWIVGGGDGAADMLRALRRGNAVAGEWRSPARVTVEAATTPGMGKLVVTDRQQTQVVARFSAAQPGSTLRWIVGSFVRDRAGGTVSNEPAPARKVREFRIEQPAGEDRMALDTRYGGFVRAELLNPAGHLVALSNPVHFIPFWPARWPFGRVAFDWGGVRLAGEQGLLLSSAAIDESGRLRLSANVHDAPGALVLACQAATPAAVDGAGHWRFDDTTRLLMIEGLPLGPADLVVRFPEPLGHGATAALTAIPARKSLVYEREVRSGPDPDARIGGVAYAGDAGATVAVGDAPAHFHLPIPTGEPSWVKFRTTFNSRAAGRLLVEGRECARFGPLDSLTFALPVQEGPGPTVERTLTLSLDPASRSPRPASEMLNIHRIQVFVGPGVVDY